MIRPSLIQQKTNDEMLEIIYSMDLPWLYEQLFNSYNTEDKDKLKLIMELINAKTE
jgi:hypothetical protein